jgi:hypothetical protein
MTDQKITLRPGQGKWRSWIKIHPAADLLPRPSLEDYRVLVERIKMYGLRSNPVFFFEGEPNAMEPTIESGTLTLLDGQGRLDALEDAGIDWFSSPDAYRRSPQPIEILPPVTPADRNQIWPGADTL